MASPPAGALAGYAEGAALGITQPDWSEADLTASFANGWKAGICLTLLSSAHFLLGFGSRGVRRAFSEHLIASFSCASCAVSIHSKRFSAREGAVAHRMRS
jgi:hypothetical protein